MTAVRPKAFGEAHIRPSLSDRGTARQPRWTRARRGAYRMERFHEHPESAMSTDKVRLEIAGEIARITIDRAEKRNALDRDVWQGLGDAARTIDADPSVRVAILTGAGDRAFCAGLDLSNPSMLGQLANGGSQESAQRIGYHQVIRPFQAEFSAIADCRVPVIAQVNGAAIGAGFELMLCADIRIAVADATFSIPEVKYGLVPDMGGTQRLPRLVGPGLAKELIFTAKRIDAHTALEWGLVDHLAERAELAERVDALAAEIAGNAPLAVQAAKRAVNASMQMSSRDGLEYEATVAATCLPTDDMGEAFGAMMEKRPPKFAGA